MKKILIINAHPKKESFNFAIAETYKKSAEANNAEVKQINLYNLQFEPFLHDFNDEVSDDIKKAQDFITWAEHLVWIYPTWWSTMPAIVKAFIEQTFRPDFAFKYKKSDKFVKWDKYLTNKSARIISTMDSPPLYYAMVVKDPGFKTMKDIFKFCGIKPVKRTYFGSVKHSSDEQRKKWLKQVEVLGRNFK